ncbi:MAG: hypothetical protein HY559_02530 [Gammaproteobacteria bacterium]|nr:hypothetical protein [Gammaproteobacteria bacterium]
MNVRLTHQHIRFRITASELQTLLAGEALQTMVTFPDRSRLIFHVMSHPTLKVPFSLKHTQYYWTILFFRREDHHFYLNVSKQTLVDLNRKIPSKEGTTATLDNRSSEPLQITLEVDVLNP